MSNWFDFETAKSGHTTMVAIVEPRPKVQFQKLLLVSKNAGESKARVRIHVSVFVTSGGEKKHS